MQNRCVHDLRAICDLLRMFYPHTQTTVDAVTYKPDKLRLSRRPQFEPHAWIKMVLVLGSLVCSACTV